MIVISGSVDNSAGGWNSNAGCQTVSSGLSLKIIFRLSNTYSRTKQD